MAWYDYIPVVGSISRLAEGDYKGAASAQFLNGSVVGQIGNQGAEALAGKGDSTIRREGYDDAIKGLQDLANQQRAFQMQGLDKALGYYDNAEKRVNSIYGSPDSFRR